MKIEENTFLRENHIFRDMYIMGKMLKYFVDKPIIDLEISSQCSYVNDECLENPFHLLRSILFILVTNGQQYMHQRGLGHIGHSSSKKIYDHCLTYSFPMYLWRCEFTWGSPHIWNKSCVTLIWHFPNFILTIEPSSMSSKLYVDT